MKEEVELLGGREYANKSVVNSAGAISLAHLTFVSGQSSTPLNAGGLSWPSFPPWISQMCK